MPVGDDAGPGRAEGDADQRQQQLTTRRLIWGTTDLARFSLKPVSLSEFSVCIGALLCVQYWAGVAAMLVGSGSLEGIVETFTQVSVLPVVEWYVLFGMIRGLDRREVSSVLAYGSLALIVVASVTIHHQRVAFLWEAVGLFVLWIGTPVLRRIGLILLILALQREQGLTPLHGLVSWLDAHMVSGLMSLVGHPVTRVGNLIVSPGMPNGLVVLAGCASTHLMIPMGLGLVALLLAGRDRLTRAAYGWIGVTLAVAVAMNIVRLTLMLRSHAAYQSWHEGTGASIVSVTGLIVTLAAWMAASGRTGTAP